MVLVRVVLASICVCIALVTPSRYPASVEVTALTDTSPLPSDTNNLETVKFAILLNAIAADDFILALTIFVIVLLSSSIVLFVSVSVVSFRTIVPVAFGSDIVLSPVGSTVVYVVS